MISFFRFFYSPPFWSPWPLPTRAATAPQWSMLSRLGSRRRRASRNRGFVIYRCFQFFFVGPMFLYLETNLQSIWLIKCRDQFLSESSRGRNLSFHWRSDGLWGKRGKLTDFTFFGLETILKTRTFVLQGKSSWILGWHRYLTLAGVLEPWGG